MKRIVSLGLILAFAVAGTAAATTETATRWLNVTVDEASHEAALGLHAGRPAPHGKVVVGIGNGDEARPDTRHRSIDVDAAG